MHEEKELEPLSRNEAILHPSKTPWSHLDVRSPAPQMTWRTRVERFFQSVRDLKQAGKTPALRLIARGGVAPAAGPRRPCGNIKWSNGSPFGRKEGQGQQKVRAFVKKGTPTGGQGLSRFPGLRPLNGLRHHQSGHEDTVLPRAQVSESPGGLSDRKMVSITGHRSYLFGARLGHCRLDLRSGTYILIHLMIPCVHRPPGRRELKISHGR